MRKPNWLDLGIAVLGLFLVCSAAQGVAQTNPYTNYGGSSGGTGMQSPSTEDSSVGDVTQDSRITGTSDGMGSTSGLVTDDTPQETGTGGAGTAGQATGGSGAAGTTGQGTETGTGGSGTAGQGTDTGSRQTSVDAAQQRLEVARLRTEVTRLEQQLAQMRAQLSAAESGTGGSGQGGSGVGGSGSAGIGDANAEAPGAATGVGDTSAEGVGGGGTGSNTGSTATRAPDNRPDTSNQGYAEVNVIYTGRIRSVTAQRLVLEDSGILNTMPVAPNVRVLNEGKQVSLQSLREGTSVRVSADLYARGNPVTEIQVLPAAPATR
jgi:hypothetical protein